MEDRILVLARRGRDAVVITQLLQRQGHLCCICDSGDGLARQLDDGAGAVVVTEESLAETDRRALSRWISAQPTWSDFPFILLATRRAGRRTREAAQMLEALGNVVVLERPINGETLISAAASALRGRRRQHEARRHLEALETVEEQLRLLNATLETRIGERTQELTRANARLMQEVAERERAQAALVQSQKMEAVGQLTGGVAHDFNNLLTVIIGGLDTIRRAKPDEQARIQRALDMAIHGAQRATSLTTRLLAFSRRQPLAPKPIALNRLVTEMTDLLRRSLGEQVELKGLLAPDLWMIEADQNQLESAILNLAVNARDAMPDGGELTIQTANVSFDGSHSAADTEVIPGKYVMIDVSDTGDGMSEETISRAFEPFFTTKQVGRGTGLGLSMIYGFAKQSGGHVTISSELGRGTTVKLYFPRYMGEARAEEAAQAPSAPRASADEVVLLVEDNDDVRTYSAMILCELGYGVVEARHTDAALALLGTDQRVDLLFTDVVLPGRSGRTLADEAEKVRPGLKVLFTTGYSRNELVHNGRLDAGVQLITKPFTFDELAVRVRNVLDRIGG